MLFCINLPNIIYIGPPIAEIWRHIDFFQDGNRGRSILFPVSYLLMSLLSEGQNLQANQFCRQINSRLRYYYFRFGKTNVRHIGIQLPVSISTISPWSGCITLPNFVQIGPPSAVIWCHIDFQDGGRQPCCICFADNGRPPTKCLSWSELDPQIACSLD